MHNSPNIVISLFPGNVPLVGIIYGQTCHSGMLLSQKTGLRAVGILISRRVSSYLLLYSLGKLFLADLHCSRRQKVALKNALSVLVFA